MADKDQQTPLAKQENQNQPLAEEQKKKPTEGQEDYKSPTLTGAERAAAEPDFMKRAPGNPPRIAAQFQDEVLAHWRQT